MGSVTIYYHWNKNLNVNRMEFMGFMGFRDNEKFLIKLDEFDVRDEWYKSVVDVLLIIWCLLCNFRTVSSLK